MSKPNFSLIIAAAVCTRILLALSTRTFFQPDEYFQSLEPAHHLVFGYGDLTWEWLNPRPIRSILFPGISAAVYATLHALGLLKPDGAFADVASIAGPKVAHGLLAALTDIGLCRMTQRVLGDRYVYVALVVSLSSFFHALSLSRSLSNSVETSLTSMALSYFPWTIATAAQERSDMRKMLCFAALACAVRPTNAVIWVWVVGFLLASRPSRVYALCLDTAIVGITSLLGILALDSWYFQEVTFTPLNFLLTNLSDVSSFYGMSTWHYYLTQGIPILCTTSLPFVAYGLWRPGVNRAAMRVLSGLVLWTVAFFSFSKHKEWRFIHPILPVLHLFAAKGLLDLFSSQVKNAKSLSFPVKRSHLCLLLSTLPISAYIVLFYCSGPISVMHYLRGLPGDEISAGGVGILMPCHSTPGQAYLHRPQSVDRIWSLGCEPPLGNTILKEYKDQTDIFFEDPVAYLETRFPLNVNPSFPSSPKPRTPPGTLDRTVDWRHEWPRYLVLFGALLEEPGVSELLLSKGYREVWRAGREWEGEGKRKGAVRVWKWLE